MAYNGYYDPRTTHHGFVHSQPTAPVTPSRPTPTAPVGSPHSQHALAGWSTKNHAQNTYTPKSAPQQRVNHVQPVAHGLAATNGHGPAIPQALTHEAVKPVISRELPVDYRMLLLALADQYIATAHAMSINIACEQAPKGQYYELVATGLGCMEQVTQRQTFTLPPRTEAAAQLRYATLLHEETENIEEAEQLLGKGIVFCDRNRLTGIKYSMQNLLVKILFKSQPRAAIRMLDGLIRDCETCQHIPWTYAFRFLRVSLSIQSSRSHDFNAAIANLRAIASLSKQHSDAAVRMAALILEATVHLRARKGDWMTDTQQALASARALQTIFLPSQLSQLQILTHLLDIACSLDPYDPKPAKSKMQGLLVMMKTVLGEVIWKAGCTFVVPVNLRGYGDLLNDAEGVFPTGEDNERGLAFSWLTKTDVSILANIISAAATSAKNLQGDASKTEQFLRQGLELAADNHNLQHDYGNLPLVSSSNAIMRRRELRCYLLLQLTAAECNRSDWTSANKHLDAFYRVASANQSTSLKPLMTSAKYLEGVLAQGTGNLDGALKTYQGLVSSVQVQDTGTLDLPKFYAILATMNSLLIIRAPAHPLHHQMQGLSSSLQPHFAHNPSHPTPASQNQNLVSAYSFLLAVLPQSPSLALHQSSHQQYQTPDASSGSSSSPPKGITPTKFHLQTSLTAARGASNALMATLSLCYMNHFLFQGIVSDKAVSAAEVAEAVANQAGVAVWVDFAKAWTAETLLRQEGGGVISGT